VGKVIAEAHLVLGMIQTEDLKGCPAVGGQGPDPSASVRISGLEVAGQFTPKDEPHPEEIVEENPARRAQRPIVATSGITFIRGRELESLKISGVQKGTKRR
jgi:hypothetical protein